MSLSNLKCLVTGASSGIGKATCISLSAEGAEVIGVGRNESCLKELTSSGHISDYIVADLVEEAGASERVVKEAVEKLGGALTTLVNNAGVLRGGAAGDPSTDLSNYDFNMTLNTRVPFELMQYSVPYLEQHPNVASIVNVSSVNGKQAFAKCLTYCMSKAALDMMARCASVDLAPKGIRVNNVNPGVVKTNIHKASGLDESQYDAFVKRSIEVTHPFAESLGRIGEPSEVAEVIAFLVGGKAKFLTGECIAIDGGRQNLGSR
jgi:NAD(P)-dependent dehydrogenase (short-subunit alcohol dehydrogenase family)